MRYIYLVTCLALACSGTDPAAAPEPIQPAAELCFRVDPEVLAAFPAAEERLVEAGSAWGWPVRLGGDCSSSLELGEFERPEVGAQHTVIGWASAAWDGGASRLVLRREHAQSGKIADVDPVTCAAMTPALRHRGTLLSVLTHELGHAMIGDGHLDASGSVMAPRLGHCEDRMPSATDLAIAPAPSL
jgi:hypothetical protein